jgi:branched-chain amino acid transport system ATP-binding protein
MNEAVGGQQPALSEAEGSAVGGPSGTPLLAVEGLHVAYGRVAAVRGISFSVPEGAIVSLIGANGAGKTTTLAAISGVVPVRSGRIRFRGEEITRLPPHAIVRRGIVQVPEGRQVLAYLSVEENLAMGAYHRRLPAGSLSGGEQQMLAIARALMARPKMLLLDEPSMGLAPLLVNEIFRILAEIHAEGRTILLVEQNARKALAISDYAYVLETGRVTIAGPGADLANDERVVAAYLGRAIGKAG